MSAPTLTPPPLPDPSASSLPDPTTSQPPGALPTPAPEAPPSIYAGAVSRLAAYVLDVIIVAVAVAGGSAVFGFLVTVITGRQLHLTGERDVAGIALAVAWLVYFAGWWAVTGSTLGMALFGLRVVHRDGTTPASPLSAILRALTFPLSVLLFGLGFLGILFHPRRRALHDLLAGTAVVYAPRPSPRRL
jgi:uncharacterized RDD family membrane protein YckC